MQAPSPKSIGPGRHNRGLFNFCWSCESPDFISRSVLSRLFRGSPEIPPPCVLPWPDWTCGCAWPPGAIGPAILHGAGSPRTHTSCYDGTSYAQLLMLTCSPNSADRFHFAWTPHEHHFYYCYSRETGATSTTRKGPIPKNSKLSQSISISHGGRQKLDECSLSRIYWHISLAILVSCPARPQSCSMFSNGQNNTNTSFFSLSPWLDSHVSRLGCVFSRAVKQPTSYSWAAWIDPQTVVSLNSTPSCVPQHFQTMLKTKLNVLTLRKEPLPTVIFHEPEAIELCSTNPHAKSRTHAGYKVV